MITKLNAKACDSLKIYRKCYLVLLISTDQVHYGNIKENFSLYVYFTLYTIFELSKMIPGLVPYSLYFTSISVKFPFLERTTDLTVLLSAAIF